LYEIVPRLNPGSSAYEACERDPEGERRLLLAFALAQAGIILSNVIDFMNKQGIASCVSVGYVVLCWA
jgi:hypothetical protein